MPQLEGRIALVTGGKNTRALATSLARLGATVVITDPQNVVARIVSKTGNPHVHGLIIDLASPPSVRAGAEAFIARYRQLHLLVTDTTVRVGPVLLANLLLDTMKRSGRGKVVRLLTSGDQRQIWAAD